MNLNNISIDFNMKDEYQKPLFDLFFKNISMKAEIEKENLNSFNISTNQLKINYYGNNNDNKKSLAILTYENQQNLDGKDILPQIEIKKNIENKYLINITKINFVFNVDIITSLYNYFKDISIIDFLKNYIENSQVEENKKDIQVIISQIQIKIPRNRHYLDFYLNKLDFNFMQSKKGDIEDYQIKFSLFNIIANYLERKILFTKNEYLLFVFDIKQAENVSMICNSLLNKIIINLSYLNLIFIDKIFTDILKLTKYFKNEKNTISTEAKKVPEISNVDKLKNYKFLNFTEIKSILSEINIEGIDITFIEEDKNYIGSKSNYKYFYPFPKPRLDKSYLKYEFIKNKIDAYPEINFNSHYDLIISYLNYKFKTWEPLTEVLSINFNYENIIESNKLFDNYTLEINKFNVNLSENFINILLIKIFRFYNKFRASNNTYKNEDIVQKEIILKYKIYNYTNIDFEITYQNCNYKLKNSEKIYFDFHEEEDIESNLNNYILLSAENNDKKILIFPENIGIKKYKLLLNKTEREIYIETKIRQYKNIDIKIYNPN